MNKIIATLSMGLFTLSAFAATPLWLRDARISPDGSEIAFCYKGDIYKVPATGGNAMQLTTQSSYESSPVWSPDGKTIAFASDRNGNNDVFVMPAGGGAATRLTFNSAAEIPSAFTPDGKSVYFSASLQDPAESALFPTSRMSEVYSVPVKGGRTQQVIATPADMICFDKNGKFFLYEDIKGFEDQWRKHHTSSVTRDIWSYDTTTGKHTNLTQRAGEDRNPVLSPDGKTLFFLSERNGGTFNVYSAPVADPQKAVALTNFKKHPVRFLSAGANGTLCFTFDGEIYTKAGNAKPQKVNIAITRDDSERYANIATNRGIGDASVSPDGKQLAVTVRGEVFVSSVEYGTTKRITETAEGEKFLTWNSDNRTIAYACERNGNWGLYTATIAREEEANFPNATIINEEALLPSTTIERSCPQYSPDGKELAFIEGRNKLMVLNLKTKKVRQVTDGKYWMRTDGHFTYTWSPDGKWFAMEIIGNGHDPYTDIAIANAETGEITNLTNSGYFNSDPKWVMDGNAIMFVTDRYGMRNHASWGSMSDVMLVFMNQDSYDKYYLSKEDYELRKELEKEQKKKKEESEKGKDKKGKKADEKKAKDDAKEEKKPIEVQLSGITDRLVRLTPNSSDISSAYITNDGKSLYYLSAFESGYDLWKLDLRKKSTQLVQKLKSPVAMLESDAKGKNLFVISTSSIKKIDTASDKVTPVQFMARMRLDLAAERAYMFEHVYKQEKMRFYNTNMHGIDWDSMAKDYRKFLPHIANNYDFAELLSEFLGELNVSHTGGRYFASSGNEHTANLGLLYDWNYDGNGLKVSEVVEKSPFDHAASKVKAGTVIEKINGKSLSKDQDPSILLLNLNKQKTLVSLFNPATGERWEEVVLPISAGAFDELLYRRWVRQRAADVDRWSNGRLGYVHIRSMGDESFRDIYSDILGKYYKRDGIVIDVRFNGGGRLHEDIEVLFSGKKYFTQVIRGREACDMPSRRWNKPSIMLQCEACYSNAHGTPWVYKHTGIGKLVGMPVPGTMTSVSWEQLQDPSLVFGIPVIGYQLPDGSYLENSQLEPDIKVLNSPETIVKGEDSQLRTAVEELLKDIDAK